jgi:hypothetical protein
MPGSGEYALATDAGRSGRPRRAPHAVNVNSPAGTDFAASLTRCAELPNVGSGLLVVSWFGDDLRCGECRIRPKVEATERAPPASPGPSAGLTRATAQTLAELDGGPVYGGTPSDASVLQAIAAMNAAGQKVVFYPFILMEQLAGNTLPDPWTGARAAAAALARPHHALGRARPARLARPQRRRRRPRSPPSSAPPAAAFHRRPRHASLYRPRGMVLSPLHPALRGALRGADGVDAFCIGSEMRALTQIRGAGDSFPAVAALIALARDVRAILGPAVKISYAADWSEYFGYQPTTLRQPLLPPRPALGRPRHRLHRHRQLHAAQDWRDGDDHLDAALAPAIYDLDYLKANIAGGEGFDWFYPDDRGAPPRPAPRSPTARMASPGSGATRTCAPGGRTRIMTASTASAPPHPPLAAALETRLVHRDRLRRHRQGHQPAQQVPRSQILGIEPAASLERPARRPDPDAVPARAGRALDRPGATTPSRPSMAARWWTGTAPMSGPGTRAPSRGFPAGATSGPMATTGARALDHRARHEPAARRRRGRDLRRRRRHRYRCQRPARAGARLCRPATTASARRCNP